MSCFTAAIICFWSRDFVQWNENIRIHAGVIYCHIFSLFLGSFWLAIIEPSLDGGFFNGRFVKKIMWNVHITWVERNQWLTGIYFSGYDSRYYMRTSLISLNGRISEKHVIRCNCCSKNMDFFWFNENITKQRWLNEAFHFHISCTFYSLHWNSKCISTTIYIFIQIIC